MPSEAPLAEASPDSGKVKKDRISSLGIDLDHIFQPDFVRGADGTSRLTGLHHIEGPQNLEAGRVADLLSGPNKHGIYEAVVEAKDSTDGAVHQKFSTMFPDSFTHDDVAQCIENAIANGVPTHNGHIVGPSGRGFDVNIKGKTAFPLYLNDEFE